MHRVLALMAAWRLRVVTVLAILTLAVGIAGQIFDSVQEILVDRNIVGYLTLLVVIDIAAQGIGNARESSRDAAANQDFASPQLEAAASKSGKGEAQFLEYAGQTTLPIIRAAVRGRRPIRILVKHPETIEGTVQRQRSVSTLDTLLTQVFVNYPISWEIRCYKLPYSLRGRKIGNDLLEVGWLTPDPARASCHGHDNPSLLMHPGASENIQFLDMFDRTFQELWEHADSEDAALVLARLAP